MRAATAADLPAMLELLRGNDLRDAGVADHLERYIPEFADGQLVGYAGSELHGSAALLRSVAVNAEQRSSGVGAQLVRAQLEAAKNLNATSISLLTTTANTYFPRFGFAIVQRCTLPVTLNDSLELRGACSDSAICLHLSLEQRIYFV